MYEVNGIDLPSSQYRELCDLVSLGSDEERKAFSDKALRPYEDKSLWNQNGVDCYGGLLDKGLIEGAPTMGGFLFYGVVTQAGIDFVNDYKAASRREWIRTYLPSIIASVLGVGGTIAGVLLGWHLGSL